MDFGDEVGRWGFVGRSQGWKGSRNHNFRRLEEGRKTGFESHSYVGKVGHKHQAALQDMVAGVASRRDFEGIVTGLGEVDRTASYCGLGRFPGPVAA